MSELALWCFRRRRTVAAAWLAALILALGLSVALGTNFNTDLSLPNTDSQAAVNLLQENFPSAAGEGDQIVIQTTNGVSVASPAVRRSFTHTLDSVEELPHIDAVVSPYSAQGAEQVSRNGQVAFARVTWDRQSDQVTKTDAKALIKTAESADSETVRVSLSGPSITNSERSGLGPSVGVGVLAALIILLIVFGGALLSALVPLLTAILALALGTGLVGILSHGLNIASASIQLAVLIGLGVGIDYGLFIISRYRNAVKAGDSHETAITLAVNTAGRTVLFAGTTVVIALLGQLTLGVGFLDGVSIAAALAVALTMTSSLTFLPAMLGFLGPKVLSRRERAALGSHSPPPGEASGFALRWTQFVERRRALVAVGALAVVVALALPIFGLRLGTANGSTDPASWTTHQSYTALASGFGPGFNGPLELAAETPRPSDSAAFARLLTTAAATPGVASVTPPVTAPGGRVEIATVYPTTSPQSPQTINLVSTLRKDLIPQAEHGSNLTVHLGGVTPTNIDFAHELTDKLPIFVAVVVLLAFVLLTVVFRSLMIPLVASVMNLLSIGAALGAVNAVFNWGWGASVIGVSGRGPVEAFLPVVMFSVLFGLSMDYQVYLLSRMQEAWHQLDQPDPAGLPAAGLRPDSRNAFAVAIGQANSARIITAAASIMILVFGSFLLGDHRLLQEFGFGLGFSVLIDALFIRSMLVPALMYMIGPANWAIPRWLDRVLPRAAFEPRPTGPATRGQEPLTAN